MKLRIGNVWIVDSASDPAYSLQTKVAEAAQDGLQIELAQHGGRERVKWRKVTDDDDTLSQRRVRRDTIDCGQAQTTPCCGEEQPTPERLCEVEANARVKSWALFHGRL